MTFKNMENMLAFWFTVMYYVFLYAFSDCLDAKNDVHEGQDTDFDSCLTGATEHSSYRRQIFHFDRKIPHSCSNITR